MAGNQRSCPPAPTPSSFLKRMRQLESSISLSSPLLNKFLKVIWIDTPTTPRLHRGQVTRSHPGINCLNRDLQSFCYPLRRQTFTHHRNRASRSRDLSAVIRTTLSNELIKILTAYTIITAKLISFQLLAPDPFPYCLIIHFESLGHLFNREPLITWLRSLRHNR